MLSKHLFLTLIFVFQSVDWVYASGQGLRNNAPNSDAQATSLTTTATAAQTSSFSDFLMKYPELGRKVFDYITDTPLNRASLQLVSTSTKQLVNVDVHGKPRVYPP